MVNSRLVSNVRAHRQARAISQEELALLAGVSRKTINVIEGGNYAPSVALALAIAQVLHTSVEELFTLE